MIITLYLPWPQSVNHYYKQTRSGGHKYLPKVVHQYREQVCEAIHQQAPTLRINKPMRVNCELYPPDLRKRDLDNYMKGLLDAVSYTGLWTDDALIDQLNIYRGEKVKSGLVIMHIGNAGPMLPAPGQAKGLD